eukprot:GILI01014635.1.p1 GENE.GILI01014635.1~~GILI01014635.1.p1  ORF type:complete len:415 (-),score=65.03 GILI01014635.1:111-1355(-)
MWKRSSQQQGPSASLATSASAVPPHTGYAYPPIPMHMQHPPQSSSWGPLISICLEIALWYFNFIHPIYVGSKLIQKVPAPKPKEISNCVVAFALLWFLEIGDQLLLRDFIAMRNVYVVARIFFCMYLLHPRFQGALYLYERCGLRAIVDSYGGAIDSAVTQNISFLKNNGAVEFVLKLVKFALGGMTEVLYIVKQLMLPLPAQPGEGESGSDDQQSAPAASPMSLASTLTSVLSTSSAAVSPGSVKSRGASPASTFIPTPPTAKKRTASHQPQLVTPALHHDDLTASLLEDSEDEGGAPSVPASGALHHPINKSPSRAATKDSPSVSRTASNGATAAAKTAAKDSPSVSRTTSNTAKTAATVTTITSTRSRAATQLDEEYDMNFDDTLYSFANTQVAELNERMFEGVAPKRERK